MTPFRMIAGALITTVLSATGAQAASAATQGDTFERTCTHYENRSRFEWQRRNDALAAMLAESCRIALGRLGTADTGPDLRAADAAYLDLLTRFKALVIEMNVARLAAGGGQDRAMRFKSTVTRTGEYLISRHMGVLKAQHDWAEATGVLLTRR